MVFLSCSFPLPGDAFSRFSWLHPKVYPPYSPQDLIPSPLPRPVRRPPPHQRLHLRVRGGHLEPVDLLHHGAGERAGPGPGAAMDADGTSRGGGPRSRVGGAD